jgi:hypothetical protein
MATRDFELVPAGAFARSFPLLVGGFVLFAASAPLVTLAMSRQVPAAAWVAVVAALVVTVPVVGWLAWAVRHPHLRLVDGALECGRLPRLRTPVADFDLDAARVVDLDRESDLRPSLRLFGTSLPGFNVGWFWLRDRRRAFLMVTDRHKVLVLPRRDGKPLLLSALRPEALLEALRGVRR